VPVKSDVQVIKFQTYTCHISIAVLV